MANTRETVTQTYEGESIKCVKIVVNDTAVLKLPGICPINDSYIFQLVAKADAEKTIMVTVGDQQRTITLSTSFDRYVEIFHSVDVALSNDVYIAFPSGTYYLYNLQLERAINVSGWRPAPEDSEDYTDAAEASAKSYASSQVSALDASLNQQDVFNRLTNNGQTQGIYLQNGKIYINASFIQSGTISANYISGGTISGTTIDIGNGVFTVDSNGKVNASNLNMTGGTINLSTNQSNYDFIKLLFSYWSSEYKASGASFHYDNGVKPRGSMISPNGVAGYTNSDDSRYGYYLSNPTYDTASYSGALQLYDGVGTQRVYLAEGGLYVYDASGTTRVQITSDMYVLKDANGTTRMRLSESGLYFYNSSGTLTKSYSAA